jgi:glucose-6-phosphate 1-dehydrogenase
MVPTPADALVFYGATGDLAYKKIFPALNGMARHGNLPARVIAVAKSGWTLDQLRARALDSIQRSGAFDRDAFDKFVSVLSYIDGDYSDLSTFQQLGDALGGSTHPVHYLAIPPRLFSLVFRQLALSGAARNGRVVVEKPFGHELATARELNHVMHETFDERDVYRIDHYLGKNAVQATRSWNQSGTGNSSKTCRSRWSRTSVSMAGDSSTTRREPSATLSRIICCNC